MYNDTIVNSLRGHNNPIMTLNERVLSVLGCKYTDNVLIDAPYIITKEMIQSMNIAVVLSGKFGSNKGSGEAIDENNVSSGEVDNSCLSDTGAVVSPSSSFSSTGTTAAVIDPYFIPREMNILQLIDRQNTLSVYDIIRKVDEQKESLSLKFNRKKQQEEAFYAQKYGNII